MSGNDEWPEVEMDYTHPRPACPHGTPVEDEAGCNHDRCLAEIKALTNANVALCRIISDERERAASFLERCAAISPNSREYLLLKTYAAAIRNGAYE